MYVQVKSSRGINLVPAESILLTDRRVFIEGGIDSDTACEFTKQIMLLNQDDRKRPIDVLVNSTGGEINAGMLMYDVIQASKAPIRTYCLGQAYSMAAVLFACGLNGRYMLPHSQLMIHEPLLGNSIGGNASSIKSISDSLIETRKKMNAILAKHTGKTEKEVGEASSFDHFFTAEESLKFGLCDAIIEFAQILKEE